GGRKDAASSGPWWRGHTEPSVQTIQWAPNRGFQSACVSVGVKNRKRRDGFRYDGPPGTWITISRTRSGSDAVADLGSPPRDRGAATTSAARAIAVTPL